ncbi:phage major capsid protein [Streptomyces pseudogriseolus]|uniref:phage major capsid protein n=1 Tax=Streptomyces pseudogriseolus TaxID=36817 RepID=UPI003FA32505
MPKLAIPSAPHELEEMLSDPGKIKSLMAENQFGEFVSAYAQNVVNKDMQLGQQVREETQKVLAEWLKGEGASQANIDRLNLSPTQPVAPARNALYNKKAPGAVLDSEFDGSADFFQSIWHHSASLNNSDALHAKLDRVKKVQNSFGSTVPADGGFLIPETLRSEILSVALENSIVRPRARVIPMESLRLPIPAIDSTSNASSVFGGIVCYWTEEGASLVESQASFSRVVLEAKKLTGYAEIPNELVSDATAFGSFFDQVFPAAMAFYEDDAFMNGSGVGEPLGFLNASAAVPVTKESGQAADTIVWENIVKMYARMLPSSLSNAVWIASIDTFPELATMALSVGTGGSAVWLNNGVQGPPMTILGRPVYFTEKAPALGDAGDINFVDLGYYLIGDRQVMQAMSSPHYKFASDKTAFRIIERVDGRPWLESSITPKNGGAALSPFVKIAARA